MSFLFCIYEFCRKNTYIQEVHGKVMKFKLSTFVNISYNICQYIYQYYLSTFVTISQSLSIFVNICQHLTFVNICHTMLVKICQYFLVMIF